MGVADSVKTSIYSVIDTVFGSDFVITPVTKSFNTRGDEEITEGTPVTIKAVYSNNNPFTKNLQGFGDVSEGNLRLYVKSDDDVSSDSLVTFDGVTYTLNERGLLGFQDVKIVDVFELQKKL